MIIFSIIFCALFHSSLSSTLPCPTNCDTCSSSTQCTTCSQQYYSTTVNSQTQCLSCSDYCLECNSDTQCIRCLDPYVLGEDNYCYECLIENAAACSSTTSASDCIDEYYPSDNYCYSCLLNCNDCASGYDCDSCISGYYLNTTVLTCNLCPTNCTSCNQYTSTICTACKDGYSLSSSFTCDEITCSVSNCVYCSSSGVCGQCDQWYLWDGSNCVEGASILCQNGAEGYFPNECNNYCTSYSYEVSISSSAIQCFPYLHIDVDDASYQQYYYYAYNNEQQLQGLFSTSNSIAQESNSEYSYLVEDGDTLTMSSLPSYYQIIYFFKYTSTAEITLSLTATTEDDTQAETLTLQQKSTIGVVQLNTIALHSNNMQMSVSGGDMDLIELLIRSKKCPSDCYRCLNEELCEMCNDPQYVSDYKCVDNCTIYYHLAANRSCLTSCPDAYYHQNLGTNQKFCQACVSPCVNCISDSQCLSCISGQYYYNYSCVTSCPDGYFTNTDECSVCISPCKYCTDEVTCLSCDEGYWDGTQCTTECPSGQYGDNSTHTCIDCTSPCATCRNSSTTCLSCEGNSLYFHEYDCISECPDRYYPQSDLTCSQCQLPCSTCNNESSCLSCSYNYLYGDQCLSSCPDGYYQNITARECSQCLAECSTCEDVDSCTSCVSGYLYSGECVNSCPYGQYYGTCSGSCTCVECSYPCNLCISNTQCLSCLEGYLYNEECITNCPDGYYGHATNFSCELCNSAFSSCLECDADGCTHCDSNLTLHEGQCVSVCPDYYYKESERCEKCIAPCDTCSSFTNCLSCIDPYILHEDSCIIQCPYDEVALEVNGTTQCSACQSPCISCSGSTTACTLCEYGYYLYNSTCITNCSSLEPSYGYYEESITSTCNLCMFPCETCTSQTQCLSCRVGYLSGTDCEQCSYGTYADQTTGVCNDCPTECSNCYTATYCTSCQDGYFLYESSCISNSSICEANGYYVSGKVCSPCQSPCATCSGSSTNCLSCLSGYIFYQDQCITQCPDATYRLNSQCQACHSYCATCSTTDTYCFSCQSSYYLYLSNMSCLQSCPDGSYLEGTTCQSCRYPCEYCSSQAECLSCVSGTLVGTQCYASCPSGQFTNEEMMCQNCTSPCLECQNQTTNCTQCEDGYYLFETSCLSSCPSLYFAEEEAKQCLSCLGLCKDCNSYINCTSCEDDMIYYFDTSSNLAQCVSQCPTSFYNTSSSSNMSLYECAACLSECLSCVNSHECVLCLNDQVQYDGQCFAECPAQMYPSEGICQDCSQPCFNCTDTYTCTACMNDSFLLVGSAECIVGNVCPVGYYLISGTRNCNGECPDGEYHRNDRTCNSSGCDENEFMGADMFCYESCPSGFIANKTYHCNSCDGDSCSEGLFFDLSTSIKNDDLFVYIIFTEEPTYLSDPSIVISPSLPFSRIQRRLLTSVTSTRNITVQISPTESISDIILQVSFEDSLKTFSNPLQDPTESIYLQGFDLYPSLPDFEILGILALACSLAGMVKHPFMSDFGQFMFLLALITLHYPHHLASALQSTSIAQFNSVIPIQQLQAQGQHKFSYVTNLGLLSNATFHFILVGVGLLVALILLLIFEGLKKSANYNRVEDESEESEGSKQSQTKIKIIKRLQVFFKYFKTHYLNRLICFSYLPLILFTFTQYNAMSFGVNGSDTAASVFSILIIIPLLAYPIFIFKVKPKYAFLCVRKIVLALVLILSVNHATYMIGVCAIMSLMSSILVMAYKVEKWKVQTRFIMIGEVFQLFLYVFFAIFAMVGEGTFTDVKVLVAWLIIAWLMLISLGYLTFAVFQLVLWICKTFRKVDYKEKWMRQEAKTEYGKDSESNSDDMKEVQSKKGEEGQPLSGKTIKLQKLFGELQKEGAKDSDSNNNELFWTYNDNENDNDDEEEKKTGEEKPPQMLIRCVNEFSDVDSENP